MFLLIAKLMGVWTVVALSTGFAVGALIQEAEKLRKKESVAAINMHSGNERRTTGGKNSSQDDWLPGVYS